MYPVSARFLEVLTGSHRAVMRARVFTSPQVSVTPVGGLELPILSGNVKMAATADVKSTLELSVPGEYWEEVQPYSGEIFVERGVDFGDGTTELVPLGWYRITKASQDDQPSGPVRLSGSDRIVALQQNRVLYPFQVPTTYTHRMLFERLVNGRVLETDALNSMGYAALLFTAIPITWVAYDPDRYTVDGGQTVEDSTYDFMAKLADDKGAVLRFDESGGLVIDVAGRDPDTTPIYVVQPGSNGNLIKASRETSRDATYNIVVAYGSDPAFPTGYQLAYNTDPNSPLRWDGPFGPAPRYYASPLLRDANGAAAAAATVLSKYTGLPTTQGLWTLPNPALRPFDMLSARVVGLPEKHLIDEITIPLGGNDPTQVTTKTAASVVEPTPGPTNGGGTPDPDGGGFTQAQIDQEKAFEITSTAENSTLQWWTKYDYIEDIGDGRGYTAGLVGFTSADGDMEDMVKNYLVANEPTSPLASFLTGLHTCTTTGEGGSASSAASTNLGTSYITAWKNAATSDEVFRKAQRDYRSDHYWGPAFAVAQADGLRALGAALYYDTYVNHGPGDPNSGDGSFEDIRSSVSLPGGGGGGSGTNVGKTTDGTGASASTANKTVVSKFTAGAAGTLDTGHARLWISSGSGSIEMVVYADSSGAPGALLATSGTVSVTNTTEDAIAFAFTGSNRVAIASGTDYWVGFTWPDPGSPSISWSRDTTASQAQQNGSHAAATFGTATALSGPIDAYVTLAASGSTGTLSDADEKAYLLSFIAARSAVLSGPLFNDNPPDGRIHMFTDLVNTGNLTLTTPFSWSVYGDAYQLAQDPTPRDVPGATGGPTNTGFTTPGAALNIRKADGGNHFNIGVAYGPDNPFGSAPVHHDYSMSEIENGLNLPGHYELMPTGMVRYTVPLDGGRTSTNTKFPRVEHRGLNPDNSKQAFNKGTSAYIKCRTMPIKVPPNKPEWVPIQFHDANDDVAMIHVHDNLVRAKIKGEYVGTITSSWDKTMTDMKIEVTSSGTVNFYFGSLTTPAYTDHSWEGGFTGWYGKIGAYSQTWGYVPGDTSETRSGAGATDDTADGPLIIETDPAAFEIWQDGWAKPARLTPPAGGGIGGTGGGTGGTTPPPSTGFHADLYVATTGSDSNSGTSATSPKATIAAAITAASAGQTISVASGTYTGNVVPSKGGTAGSYITVRSAVPRGAVISGNGSGNQSAVEINHPYLRFQDMTITGDPSSVRYGVMITADNVDILNCHVHNICQFRTEGTSFQGGGGIDFEGTTHANIRIDGNELHAIGPGVGAEQLTHGMYLSGNCTNVVISNNLIYDCEDFGIQIYPTASSSGIAIVNNTITGCGRGILQANGGITRNNISYNNLSSNYDIRGTGNVLSNNFSGGTGDVTGITGVRSGMNPQFVRLATDGTGDFHLQSSSPCIDAGTATDAPGIDFAGQARPWGSGIDAGAFEYVAASTGGGSTAPPSSDDGTQAAITQGWGPVIDGDEFDYSGAPTSAKWSMYDGPGHDNNGIRSPSAFSVSNGVLTCYGDNVNGGTTGGMEFKRETKYVRIEWRVRTYSVNPQGSGNRYHPVLIMWPTSDSWPQDGEYDFFECDCDSGTYEHYEHIPGNGGSAPEHDAIPLDISNWHNYAFEWSKTGIKGFIDGKQVWQYTGSYVLAPHTMHPTFQLDNFFGSKMEPAKFEAKFVRIYASPS